MNPVSPVAYAEKRARIRSAPDEVIILNSCAVLQQSAYPFPLPQGHSAVSSGVFNLASGETFPGIPNPFAKSAELSCRLCNSTSVLTAPRFANDVHLPQTDPARPKPDLSGVMYLSANSTCRLYAATSAKTKVLLITPTRLQRSPDSADTLREIAV